MRRTTIMLATALLMAGTAQAHSVVHPHRVIHTRNAAVSVPLDQVRLMVFTKPVSTLYVGNPVIADITVIDKRHAFVLGKAFGTTNIIALDASGAEISNRTVVVSATAGSATVTLQRGAARVTYACAARNCEASPALGDGKESYDAAMDQIQKHQDLLTKTATSSQQ